MSAYSGRSIPRPRVFAMDQPPSINDDLRSHISHFSGMGGKSKPRYKNDFVMVNKNLNYIVYIDPSLMVNHTTVLITRKEDI